MRIAIAGFSDETCTFCKDLTTIERFEAWAQRGQQVIDGNRGIPTYINGYIKVLEAEGAEIVPVLNASKGPGGFSTWLTPDCFDKYSYEIRDGLRKAGKVDGVLLSLHGAMAAANAAKPEAEIVRRARQAVGAAVPIMVTLDLHANEDWELADAADGVFILKTYPHIDSEEIGEIAARCMVETVRGNFRPTMAMRKPPIVSASIYQASAYHPMKDIYDRCREWESKGVFCASVAPGYAYADVVDVGMSVFVVTNNDQELAEKAAQDIADLAWSLRESFAAPLPNEVEATKIAMQYVAEGNGPVVVADGADRIGDSTHMLKELIRQGTHNWAIPCIADRKATAYLEQNHKVGDRVTISIGGWYDEFSGTPCEVTGTITYMGRPEYVLLGPMEKGRKSKDGFSVTLDLGRNRWVVVTEMMRWVLDGSSFTAVGIDYMNLDIIVLKDRVHHRAFWDGVSKTNLRTSVPGQGPADLRTLHYNNVPADVFPVGRKWNRGRVSVRGLS